MTTEKRRDPRIEAKGLKIKINVYEPNGSIFVVDGNLLNVSRSGMKLKARKSLAVDIATKLQIEMILSNSGVPFIVTSVVVRIGFESELGVCYIDLQPNDPIDQLIAECRAYK